MATRMILKNGDPQLRKHCHEVKDFNPRLHMLLDDMRPLTPTSASCLTI